MPTAHPPPHSKPPAPPAPPAAPATFALRGLRRQRWARYLAYAVAGVLALWLISWLALPPLLKSQLQRIASEQLGRPVTVDSVDFKPWSLELALNQLAIGAAPGAADQRPQLHIARIYADAELQSIVRLAPVVDALTIEQPVLRLEHLGAGRYDVDDILAKLNKPAPAEPSNGPARLALYNLALTGGQVDFKDASVNQTHEVRELTLKVPFISTLASQREIKVAPHLSLLLDGSLFDTTAEGTPFAQTGKTDARIRLDHLDLKPYLGYLPATLPVQPLAATLDVDVNMAFEQHPRTSVKLSGSVQTLNVQVADRAGGELLAFDNLRIDMADVRPLEQQVQLDKITLKAPVLHVRRDAQGGINLARLATGSATAAPAATTVAPAATTAAASPEEVASAADPTPASAPASAANSPAPAANPWAVQLAQLEVQGGTVHWHDASTHPAAAIDATEVTLAAQKIALPLQTAVPFQGGLAVNGGSLQFEGEATTSSAKLQAQVKDLALQTAAPYLAATLEPELSGQLQGTLGVQWTAPTANEAARGRTGVTVTAGPLALEKLALRQGKTTLAGWGQLDITGAEVALDARRVHLQSFKLTQPQATVSRSADGRWMYEPWLKSSNQAAAPGTATTPAHPAEAPWKLHIADLAVENGAVSYTDHTPQRPVALDVSTLDVQAKNFTLDGSKPEALTVSGRATDPRRSARSKAEPGRFVYSGTLALQPLATQGKLQVTRFPLRPIDGYLAGQVSLELLRGYAGFRGQLDFQQRSQGPALQLQGDVAIDNLQANSTAAFTPKTEAQVGEELLSWKSLNLTGLSVATAPGAAPHVSVKETGLTDLFARVTLNESGRLNLSDLAKTEDEVHAANAASAAAAKAPAASAAATAAAAAPAASASAPAVTTATAAAAPVVDPLAPVMEFGPVTLVNGRVLFSDFFIKPNYSADLSQLTGKLSAFASQPPGGVPQMADLELRGRAEGSAALEITGKLNPLAQPLALDIVGKVRDLELPPLSPYAVKYAGHGIERGNMSVDVNYKIEPNGQLTATNKLVLHQLTFSDPVAGAPNSLPVRLAVALLADRNGVIDLDLPLSGSLNDPQFKIGPVIFKIIGNLITKAITAPFSLLANALGGGDELSSVSFTPGSATLTEQARNNLNKVVKALTDRPSLKITVTGMASLSAEGEGMRRERLNQMVLAEKRRKQPDFTGPVAAEEYSDLLKTVYRRSDITKPRNLVGLAKDLSDREMEDLLMANISPTEAMSTELAAQRAQSIRSFLLEQQLPAERVVLAAAKSGKQPEKWTPRAELSLAAQ